MRDYHLLLVMSFLFVIGILSAWHFSDAHLFERFGALISGSAAIFVVMQVLYEIHLEEQRTKVEHKSGKNKRINMFLPHSLLERVDRAITKRALEDLHAKRMRFVVIVAITTFAGETIHGFGDIIYEAIIWICGNVIFLLFPEFFKEYLLA